MVTPFLTKLMGFCGVATLALLFSASCSRDSNGGVRLVSRCSVETAHGLNLPQSARNCQQKRVGGFLDHGVLSLFELDQMDVKQFLSQLKIKSRNQPTRTGRGDPCVNGWNVWPENTKTFVPGNRQLKGLKQTWTGETKPIEMLSCSSPKGDWLHVEIWSVENHALIKLYTDWN